MRSRFSLVNIMKYPRVTSSLHGFASATDNRRKIAMDAASGEAPRRKAASHHDDSVRAEVVARYLSGETQHSIARVTGLQQSEVSRLVAGAAPPDRARMRASGQNNGRAKLTDMQVEEIRRTYATGESSQRDLAKKFDVTQSLISLIVSGKIRPPSPES